mmetsp:Transcript_12591/g.28719  ORF Transcript_12591/g.28719 Transcript_12591/m.28719 type:complete len:217 (+) Transcript_12591:73-723(+)
MHPDQATPAQPEQGAQRPQEAVLLANPDGSMATGVPPGLAGEPKMESPQTGYLRLGSALFTVQDFIDIFHRHLGFFQLLVFFLMLIEVLYLGRKFVLREDEILLIHEHYPTLSLVACQRIFFGVLGLECGFLAVTLVLAVVACWSGRPKYFKIFGDVCLGGVAGSFLLAYLRLAKVNLLVVLLRMLAWAYSHFMGRIGRILLLNRQAPAAAPAPTV